MIRPLFVAAALVLAPASLAAAPDIATQRYACDRGVMVPATYVNAADGGVVVLHVDGTQITLVGEPSASGARYGWPSGGSGYVWWTKGDAATLYWKTPEGENPILSCDVSG